VAGGGRLERSGGGERRLRGGGRLVELVAGGGFRVLLGGLRVELEGGGGGGGGLTVGARGVCDPALQLLLLSSQHTRMTAVSPLRESRKNVIPATV